MACIGMAHVVMAYTCDPVVVSMHCRVVMREPASPHVAVHPVTVRTAQLYVRHCGTAGHGAVVGGQPPSQFAASVSYEIPDSRFAMHRRRVVCTPADMPGCATHVCVQPCVSEGAQL